MEVEQFPASAAPVSTPSPGQAEPAVVTCAGYVGLAAEGRWHPVGFALSGTSLTFNSEGAATPLDLAGAEVREIAPPADGLSTLQIDGPGDRTTDIYVPLDFGALIAAAAVPAAPLAVTMSELGPDSDGAPIPSAATLGAASPPPPPVAPTIGAAAPDPAPAAEQEFCPYCQTEVSNDTTVCDRCGATHHADCWVESGGCAMVGCVQSAAHAAPAAGAAPGAAPSVPAPSAWGSPPSPGGAPVPAGAQVLQPPVVPTAAALAQVPPKRTGRRVLYAALLIALPVLAVVGTMNNWFEPITGHLYNEEKYEAAKDAARESGYSDGRSDGYDSGYDSGKSAGYASGKSEGYATGRVEGCRWVFDTLGTYLVYDRGYSYGYGTTYYLSESQCG